MTRRIKEIPVMHDTEIVLDYSPNLNGYSPLRIQKTTIEWGDV